MLSSLTAPSLARTIDSHVRCHQLRVGSCLGTFFSEPARGWRTANAAIGNEPQVRVCCFRASSSASAPVRIRRFSRRSPVVAPRDCRDRDPSALIERTFRCSAETPSLEVVDLGESGQNPQRDSLIASLRSIAASPLRLAHEHRWLGVGRVLDTGASHLAGRRPRRSASRRALTRRQRLSRGPRPRPSFSSEGSFEAGAFTRASSGGPTGEVRSRRACYPGLCSCVVRSGIFPTNRCPAGRFGSTLMRGSSGRRSSLSRSGSLETDPSRACQPIQPLGRSITPRHRSREARVPDLEVRSRCSRVTARLANHEPRDPCCALPLAPGARRSDRSPRAVDHRRSAADPRGSGEAICGHHEARASSSHVAPRSLLRRRIDEPPSACPKRIAALWDFVRDEALAPLRHSRSAVVFRRQRGCNRGRSKG